ncbi:MAG: hypothetical protein U9R64_12810 [Pseudomonadota bacterium]|nr:hypothetical protein [Pseudomonadota bacterium]
MRRILLFWLGQPVGTIEVPDSFRMPISQDELDRIPTMLIIRSRTWLYDVRWGDVVLKIQPINGVDEVVAVASERMCPGDIGCIAGFEASPDRQDVRPDEFILSLADALLRNPTKQRGSR